MRPSQLIEAKQLTAKELAAANDRVREWLERRLETDSLDIARLFRSSRDALVQKIRWIYDSYLGETPTYLAARASGALRRLHDQIEFDVQTLTDEMGQRAVAKVGETMNALPGVVDRRLARLTKLPFRRLPISTQAVLGELTTSVVAGGTFFDRLFHIDRDLKDSLSSSVRTSLLNGETFDELRARVHKAFGVDKLAEPKGTAYGSVKLYKNEARRQWNSLMFKMGRAVDGVMVWLATIDERTTPGCLARHGQRIDSLGEAPPRHYNCRCTVAVMPQGVELEALQAEATPRLQAEGYTRRQAILEEAQAPGWAWGRFRIQPALIAARMAGLREAGRAGALAYAAVPWRQLPAFAAGRLQVTPAPLAEALALDRPDCALLRASAAGWEAKTWQGWAPLRAITAPLMEVGAGWVPDAPDAPEWDEPRLRLPLDLLGRWPAMAKVTFPAPPGGGKEYALALASPPEAEAAALGRSTPGMAWEQGELGPAIWRLLAEIPPGLAENPLRTHPHLLLAFLGEQPRCRMVADLQTGQVLLADEPFGRGEAAPYRRAAALIREPGSRVWAVRPRGLTFWTLPGGHIDPGEDLATAAAREALEETGLRVRPQHLVGTLYRPWSTTEVVACARTGEPDAPRSDEEIDAVACIPFGELASDERSFLLRHGAGPER